MSPNISLHDINVVFNSYDKIIHENYNSSYFSRVRNALNCAFRENMIQELGVIFKGFMWNIRKLFANYILCVI